MVSSLRRGWGGGSIPPEKDQESLRIWCSISPEKDQDSPRGWGSIPPEKDQARSLES